MIDIREAILSRLVAAAAEIDGVARAARNVNLLSEAARPAIIVFDGDEAAEEGDPIGRPSNAPRRIQMTPEIHVLLGSSAEDAGTWVNTFLLAIKQAISTDGDLIGIVGTNGAIRYDGCVTDFGDGRMLQARMRIAFTFTYIQTV